MKITKKHSMITPYKNTMPTIKSILIISLFIPFLTFAQVTSSVATAEVAKHATKNDCWIIVSNKVYSVTSYIPMHPGGQEAIVNLCGKDATIMFETKGGNGRHSSGAHATLGNFLVGDLAKSTSTIISTSTKTILPKTSSSSPSVIFKTCKEKTIEERDVLIISSRDTYNKAIQAALLSRKENEKAASNLDDITEKKIALKKVANDYRTATKKAQTLLTESRKKSWEVFETNSKICTSVKKTTEEKNIPEKKKEGEKKKEISDQKKNEVTKEKDGKKIEKEESEIKEKRGNKED